MYVKDAPQCDREIVQLGIPILGICYGMQLGCQMLGATVKPTPTREYGRTSCSALEHDNTLFKSIDKDIPVWMSHGDQVVELPGEFESLALTKNCPYAAVKHKKRPFYGVQFHPEVTHTLQGSQIIRNFLYEICGCTGTWAMHSYLEQAVRDIRSQVGDQRSSAVYPAGWTLPWRPPSSIRLSATTCPVFLLITACCEIMRRKRLLRRSRGILSSICTPLTRVTGFYRN